jgi:ABC-type molybdate transport system permease subunit
MFTMTVAIVGAGVLALPFAVHKVRTPLPYPEIPPYLWSLTDA